MSLAVKRAAEATGHGVTYVSSEPKTRTRAEGTTEIDRSRQADFRDWIDVTDFFAFNRYLGLPPS